MSDHDKEHGDGEAKAHSGGGHRHGGGGHGGGAHEEHEGVPEWMVSFADNTALMMGLFVILLAMNMGPKATSVMGGEPSETAASPKDANNDMLDFVIGLREAFNNPVDIDSTNPKDSALRRRLLERLNSENATSVTPGDEARTGGAVRPTEYNDIGASIPFDDSQSVLSPTARQGVIDTARKLVDSRYIVEVRGHAGSFETFENVEKGWNLSFERAKAVAREMQAQGVASVQIRVIACGDNERIVGRTFKRQEDANNQRVEIILTKELVPGMARQEKDAGAK